MNHENKIQADHLETLENETIVNSTSTAGKKVQNILPGSDSGVSRIDANREQKPDRRRKVYLHSIGRFRNLKKIQTATLGFY